MNAVSIATCSWMVSALIACCVTILCLALVEEIVPWSVVLDLLRPFLWKRAVLGANVVHPCLGLDALC